MEGNAERDYDRANHDGQVTGITQKSVIELFQQI